MTNSLTTRNILLTAGLVIFVFSLFAAFFVVSAQDASAGYSCTCNCFDGTTENSMPQCFAEDMTRVGCWCPNAGAWGLAECRVNTSCSGPNTAPRASEPVPTSPQRWYFCATKSPYNFSCLRTDSEYATKEDCEDAVGAFRTSQTTDPRCYPAENFTGESTCRLNCARRWYFCGAETTAQACLLTDYSYTNKDACEAAVSLFRTSQTQDPRCYETSSQCGESTFNACVNFQTLNVRARVGGAPLDGVTITRVSGTSGMGGVTAYTKSPTSPIDVTLQAPASARGYYFDRWAGCDSTSGRNCRAIVGRSETQTITALYNDCKPNDNLQCYNGDSYWYDSCGTRGQKNEECGVDSTGDWANFCKNGDQHRRRTIYDRGCSSTTGVCFNNTTTQEQFVQSCNQCGCSSAQCLPPKIEAGLIANPSSGTEPLDVELRASAGGCAQGPINYHMWWDCSNETTSWATAEASCGTLPVPASGSCTRSGIGMRCIGVTNDVQTAIFPYIEGDYTAKVIIERDVAPPATAQANIHVDPLFIPEVLPNPFAKDDAGFAVYNTATSVVVVATPLYVLMLLVAGYQFLIAGGDPSRIVASKNIAIYSTIGYGAVVVLWMTTAAISGALF